MGKDFKKEIEKLNIVHEAAILGDIDCIVEFIRKYEDIPCLSIGSGGSFSVAAIFEYLFTIYGGLAKKITPLELSNYQTQLRRMTAVLFSAGGRNRDSLNAYQYLSESEPIGLLTCCMSKEAPIKKIQRNNLHNHFYEYSMPVRKDGYLAVESIVSSLILLCRAFEKVSNNSFYCIPNDFIWNQETIKKEQGYRVLNKSTLIVLHGGITTPAAIDLESKFGESSLGNIQLIDFRNFAHGRHFWLTDRKETTSIISMSGKSDFSNVEKMLNLLPDAIPLLRVTVEDGSVCGLFQSFRSVFELVNQAGEIHNINPGKPKVADYGKKIYHLNCNYCKNEALVRRKQNTIEMAIYRKCGEMTDTERALYYSSAFHQKELLHTRWYKGLIFDFDGTLYDGTTDILLYNRIYEKICELVANDIKVGIATGRGKSIRIELQKTIPKQYWGKIMIAYYNGGCISSLDDNMNPDKINKKGIVALEEAATKIRDLSEKNSFNIEGIDEGNPYQITIFAESISSSQKRMIRSVLKNIHDIKVLESSHSMDIIPYNSSKNNLLDYYIEQGYSCDDFIMIGDSGQVGGNDNELLNHENSLSVDQVSDSIDNCWNFAKSGFRNLEATLFYLDRIIINEGCFSFRRW